MDTLLWTIPIHSVHTAGGLAAGLGFLTGCHPRVTLHSEERKELLICLLISTGLQTTHQCNDRLKKLL